MLYPPPHELHTRTCILISFNFPLKRITIPEIKQHPWFLKNLPKEIIEIEKNNAQSERDQPAQSVEEIMRIIQEAKIPGTSEHVVAGTSDDLEGSLDSDIDVSGDIMPPT